MTTPAQSYYEDMIRSDPAMRAAYARHSWPKLRSPRGIRSFSLEAGDIFDFTGGTLTVRKMPPHPDWHAPAEYLAAVTLKLTPLQLSKLRRVLEQTPFSRLHTDPCSFVNLFEGYRCISQHFSCRFRYGREYHFASQSEHALLKPLVSTLAELAAASPEYRRITAMESWIFDWNRFGKLKEESASR